MPKMILKTIGVLLFFFITTLWGAGSAEAAVKADVYITNITINEQEKKLNPAAIIVNDRALLPLRFIIEDDSLQGQVYWDEKQKKVAVDCRGHYFEFFIDNPAAYVNSVGVTLDTAPFINNSRTYIPLRFFAEHLGAEVNWDPATRKISLNFPAVSAAGTAALPSATAGKLEEIYAYYYRSPAAELERCLNLCTTISFRWLETNAKGDLFYEYQDQYDQVLAKVKRQGKKAEASVVLMDPDALHELVSQKANRSRLINNLTELAYEKGYDGINIDFEMMRAADKAYFTTFLKELKGALGKDKSLSVAVFARTAADTWSTPYDYKEIGNIADQVIVMAYDYSYVNTAPGPIAPLWWVQNVADYMVKQMAKEKVIMGLATYGYDWAKGSKGATVTFSKLEAVKSKYNVKALFDEKSQSPYYTYYDEQGKSHEIWMENQRSLQAKVTLSKERQLGGVAFWRIGNGFDDLYRVLENNIK